MIKKLYISNYALIDKLEIDFGSGFSVITGETGAGKSIILGALSLILGQRADTKSLKNASEKSVVEGSFDITAYRLQEFFEAEELDYDASNCILRREILPSGKSRAFINDTPVSVALLKELGERLIDIHSQHQNLLLGDSRFQLRVIDVLAGNAGRLADYRATYNRWKELLREQARLEKADKESREEEDFLRFQYTQLDEAKLQQGEQEALENEQQQLAHAEEIKEQLYALCHLFDAEEAGLLTVLKSAWTRTQSLSKIYPSAEDLSTRLESDFIDLKDISETLSDLQERVVVDPARLEWVEARLDLLYTLQQKHRVRTEAELIGVKEQLEQKLRQIDGFEQELAAVRKAIEEQTVVLERQAAELTAARRSEAERFSRQLIERTRPLGMPNLQFSVGFIAKQQYDEMGAEQAQFLFAANKNQSLQPVEQIASGGEISRLMLSVKSLVADAMALPTIIFDEVDTGVSGEIADKMGEIMRGMSSCMQVMTITHLPQVAVKGDTHYRVYKHDTDKGTETCLIRLSKEERLEEIARMLSGAQLTEAALNNARELLRI